MGVQNTLTTALFSYESAEASSREAGSRELNIDSFTDS
jgi:hypothetical protein